jgi:hypothetical protein
MELHVGDKVVVIENSEVCEVIAVDSSSGRVELELWPDGPQIGWVEADEVERIQSQ